MLKLKSLTFEALRGATQPFELKFETGKKIAIVFGENGSGKSTICDALDLLGNGGLGSLEGKGLSSTTKYWHSTTRKATDIRITLTSTADSWSAQVIKGNCVVEPADTRPRVKILRRHQILNLLAGRPADRYQALRPFLAIESLDESERSLRDLINSTKRRLAEAGARIGENVETLENVWKQAGSPGSDLLKWAEAEAQREVAHLNNAISTIQEYQRITTAFASRMADLSTQTDADSVARATLEKAETDLAAALANAEDGSEELTQLLQAASHYFERHQNPEACPLCQSREFADGLPQSVESTLKVMGTVRRTLESRKAAERARETAASRLEGATAAARLSADQLRALCVTWPKDLPPATDVLQVQAGKTGWSQEELRRLIDSATEFRAAVESELSSRTQMKTLLRTVRDALDQYKHNILQKTELDSLLPRLEKTNGMFVSERRAFVDEVLTKIASRVGELYEEIHPGEGLSKISLQLDPVKRASLDVVSEFPGATAPPPAAYLSESHLDTLGIAIFLALAELENPSDTVLVLDDVVASMDEPHVDRIINMLYDVSQNFAHCVLTTHYQPWREKFRWGKLQKGECQFVELGPWTIIAGIVTSKTTPRIEVLRSHVRKTPPEPADICACAGVFLEKILNFLADQYECSVPRRRGKPALRDLIQSINKKLRGVLRVELHDGALSSGSVAPVVHLGPVLEKLEKFANVRNVIGCHFDEISFHLNSADAVEFGEMVLQLAEALLHPDHGWPASDKSGEYWSNSGKSRRLYPLKQPS
ncbi:MAG TPA: AAA family ATPase [Pyrinomonadaceae bacterium]|nr:AAA family ATPase [Pyrinomonadaceae bacterium]